MKNLKILITGASGFIGSAMTRKLSNYSHSTNVILRDKQNIHKFSNEVNKVTIHVLDLEDFTALDLLVKKIEPDIIYNFAETAHKNSTDINFFTESITSSSKILINILEVAKKYKISKVVHACSSTIYGNHGDIDINENCSFEPRSIRGLIKLNERNICKYYANTFGVPVVLGRIFRAYGPYDSSDKLIDVSMKILETQGTLQITPDTIKRDYVYINDLINGFIQLGITPLKNGEEINFGSGVERSAKEIILIMNRYLNCEIPISNRFYPTTTMDQQHWRADYTKAFKLLNWSPSTSLENGIRDVLLWYKKNGCKYINI